MTIAASIPRPVVLEQALIEQVSGRYRKNYFGDGWSNWTKETERKTSRIKSDSIEKSLAACNYSGLHTLSNQELWEGFSVLTHCAV